MLPLSQWGIVMSTEGFNQRWDRTVSNPYQPVPTADSGLRIAHALEYIAAQLGAINAKLDRLIEKF